MASTQRFTEKAQTAIVRAQRETEERRLSQLEPEAILFALLSDSDGVPVQVLLKAGVDPATVLREAEAELARLPKLQYSAEPTMSSGARKVFEQAEREAKQFGDEFISTEHLLLGVMSVSGSPAAKLLARNGLTVDKVKEALRAIRGNQRVLTMRASSTRSSAGTKRSGA
ncbi:MAG: hypothetical protein J0H25_03500 [Rhizobiales bacterium]|nr:hypothetical protein [Hyphomicrobiales bacterium]